MTEQRPPTDPDEIALARARLERFDRDGLGHSLDACLEWSAARRNDVAAPRSMREKLSAQFPPPYTSFLGLL